MERKFTIGLLVSGILDHLTIAVCKGAMRAAEQSGVNLIIVPGKYIDRDLSDKKGLAFEYQYNSLFSYVNKDNVDAVLILADSIGCYTTKERIYELIEKYKDIPHILIASKHEGYLSVNYDNYKGIKDGLEYLIKTLKCTKIGMVGGPDDNTDALERKNTFLEVLKDNNIVLEDKYFVEGNLSRIDNVAIKKLLDDNEDIEAVFCVNDDTALALYEELDRRKMIPGKDIYVLGYDNAPFSARMKPPLSSVGAEAMELGENALRLAIKALKGEGASDVILPTRFIKRDSYGDELDDYSDSTVDKFKAFFTEIFYRYIVEKDNEEVKSVKGYFNNFIESLYELSRLEVPNNKLKMRVMNDFHIFIENNILPYADLKIFLACLNQILYMFKNRKDNALVSEDFYDVITRIYDRIISESDQYLRLVQEDEYNTYYGIKLFVNDIMQFEKGNDQSYMTLLEHLDWLDIYNAYVYVFDKPKMHLQNEEIVLPEELYLKATLKNGVVQSVPLMYQKKNLNDIFNNDLVDELSTYMVLLPLFSNEVLYGVVLCDMTEKIFENGEFLVNQMSSAVKMIQLLKSSSKVQEQLEQSLATLKENNIVLDTLSKSDALTGIWNRRGFEDAAERLLKNTRKEKKHALVAYVDMNNLKIINDKFGHDNGDFSIKAISNILTEVVSKKGITGRLGGDEFAVIIPYDLDDAGASFKAKIADKFKEFNDASEKPYMVKVSVGTYILESDNNMKLSEALIFADENLYEEKKKRSKNILKEQV